jgi:hypothetical protein
MDSESTQLPQNDPRFTLGLTLAIREILNEHGYALTGTGTELVEIQQALFRLLYIDTEIGLPAAIPGVRASNEA